MAAINPTTKTAKAPITSEHSLSEPKTMNGAQIFLQSLVEEGVDTVFGLPGGVILPIYEELPDFPLNHILVRHEQGAVHMAEGYARTTGRPGIALVTSGPGATNTVTGLADAYYDSVPIVVFTGNVATTLLGKDSFQEADIVGITRACTKHNIMVRRVEDLAGAIKEAFHVATTGRPGPVLVDMPKDVLTSKTEFYYQEAVIDLPGYQVKESYTEENLDELLAILKDAKQPVMLCGGGVVSSDSHDEVRQFAERFDIPVGCSLMGLGGFPAKHHLFMGFTGMHGQYWANIAIANADVLLVVGNRLNERQTGKADRFARNARIIHIDLDPTSLQKNVQSMLPVQGDIKTIFQRLLEKTKDYFPSEETKNNLKAWHKQIIECWKEGRVERQNRRKQNPLPEGFLSPQYVIERLFSHLPEENSFVTTEVGQHQMWAAQRFNLNRPRSFITSGGLGTMGFGFPAAIGVQAAFPDAIVVDIAGDGSFQMTLQELATACDYKLPVKVAVINNSHLGMIRQWQGKLFTRISEAKLSSPDYIKLAEAYGAKGFVVTHPSQVDDVIKEAYAIMDRPVIIDFQVHERADVYPWVPAGASNEEMLEEVLVDEGGLT